MPRATGEKRTAAGSKKEAAASEQAASKGRFKPGQSGNPGGRPKIDPAVKEALAALTVPAVQKLAELLKSDNEKIALGAVCEVLDRNLGKAVQAISDPDGNALPVNVHLYLPQNGRGDGT